jgi:nucleoside-diphosphate-sugar epimerase
VHAYDLVRALAMAATARDGSVYFVTDGRIHTRIELLQHIERAVARAGMRVHIPVSLALAFAHASRAAARIAGRKPLLTPERIRDFSQLNWTCDDSRARQELGYTHMMDIENGMTQTAKWYRENGWI